MANGSSNGIDTDFFSLDKVASEELKHLKRNLGIKETDFVFVFVGRLVGDKGINELVRAFGELKSSTNAKLLLVGSFETNLDPLLPETLNAIETDPNIIAVGFQSDVRPYFAAANALVFPSYREGFPNVVMQAGAMSLPSIVSDINGCNEIIVEGQNGIIIPPKNVDVLRTAMLQLMDDQDYYALLRMNARSMITSRYEQKVVWNAILAEYERLLGEKGIGRIKPK